MYVANYSQLANNNHKGIYMLVDIYCSYKAS